MIYVVDVATPPNTLLASPLTTILKVTNGLIYRTEISIPPGSAGLLGIRICDGGWQLWPISSGVWFRGDNEVIGFDDIYIKSQPPYDLTIYTYNLDDTYQHYCQVRVGLVTEEMFKARFVPQYGYEEFRKMLASIILQQEEERQAIIENWNVGVVV